LLKASGNGCRPTEKQSGPARPNRELFDPPRALFYGKGAPADSRSALVLKEKTAQFPKKINKKLMGTS